MEGKIDLLIKSINHKKTTQFKLVIYQLICISKSLNKKNSMNYQGKLVVFIAIMHL